MQWLQENWFWIFVAVAFVLMHLGHGHGRHGGGEPHSRTRDEGGHDAEH